MVKELEQAINLNKKVVNLRPFDERIDFEWYYKLSTKIDSLLKWRFFGSPPSRDQFAQLLYASVHCQFVAELNTTRLDKDPRLGVVVSYNYDSYNNITYLGTITNGSSYGMGVVISTIFIEYLFNTFPLRKIYFEMPEFNLKSIKSAVDRFFLEESRLKNHFFAYGRYWDYLTYALYRQDFFDNYLVDKILNRFRDSQIVSNQ
jgi:RimJ/RimL family protein N-acetyltransferase